MALFHQGGWVMWPLLALSILALAIICERIFFYASLDFPASGFNALLAESLVARDAAPLLAAMPEASPVFGIFFRELRNTPDPADATQRKAHENALTLLAEGILNGMERNLSVLSLIVRAAPLLGLLGTVLGMISTFSRLTAAQGGVDLSMLADGIWQALLTTAAGLLIAIPALLAHHFFLRRCRRTGNALHLLANTLATIGNGTTGQSRA